MSSSSEDASSLGIELDSIAQAHKLSLLTLNTHPETHQQALQQLHVAKTYILKSQELTRNTKTAKARSYASNEEKKPLRLEHMSLDNGSEPFLRGDHQSESVSVSADQDEAIPARRSARGDDEMTPETYYLTPWWRLLLKRLPWLVGLLLLQSFGATILNHYNKLIKEHLVLNFFIPMMQGTSGNAGNQPGVMVTRALGLGQLYLPALIFKEGPVAIITATVLGTIAYLRIRFVYPDDPGSAMSIALAMFIAILLAVTLSIIFSIILHKITCCDPADGAVPLLSTVSDVMSILILMAIAEKILPKPQDQ